MRVVLKIQAPLFCDRASRDYLLYDRNRSIFLYVKPSAELRRYMRGRAKAYADCEVSSGSKVAILGDATSPTPDW
jgi:hypothetical protein